MKTLLRTTMAAALLAAGYYGREWQDVIDRSVKDPIGPYEVIPYSTQLIKTHQRTGRIWIADQKWDFQWIEIAGAKKVLAKKG
jgi:hypothetical protein